LQPVAQVWVDALQDEPSEQAESFRQPARQEAVELSQIWPDPQAESLRQPIVQVREPESQIVPVPQAESVRHPTRQLPLSQTSFAEQRVSVLQPGTQAKVSRLQMLSSAQSESR
jgi:hypothetical protein